MHIYENIYEREGERMALVIVVTVLVLEGGASRAALLLIELVYNTLVHLPLPLPFYLPSFPLSICSFLVSLWTTIHSPTVFFFLSF